MLGLDFYEIKKLESKYRLENWIRKNSTSLLNFNLALYSRI